MVKKLIYSILALAGVISCQKLVLPADDSACDLRSLTVHVHYDPSDPLKTMDFDAMSDALDPETGEATFTFPRDPDLYNSETLSRCTIEASIPSTATLVAYDEEGGLRPGGLGGLWNLANGSVIFDVVASDGTTRHYDFLFRMRR